MVTSSAAKVGIAVVLAFVIFFAAWYYLGRLDLGRDLVVDAEFDDTKGLQVQTPVRMNGVVIGEVSKVSLDPQSLKPVVECALSTKKGRVPANARIRITSGLLITTPQVEIYWLGTPSADSLHSGRWPAGQVDMAPGTGLAQISPEADQAAKQLALTARQLSPRLVHTLDRLQGILNRADATMQNFQFASGRLAQIAGNRRIDRTLNGALADLQDSAAQARMMSRSLRLKVDEMVRSGGKVDQLTMGALDLLNKYADTADALRSTVTRLSEQVGDPRLMQSVQETLEMANATLARFNQVAADIHQITGDPNVQSDLKSSVATLNETAVEARQLVGRINVLVGKLPTSGGKPRLGLGQPSTGIDFLARGKAPHFRSDVSLRVPFGDGNAFNLGLYDFAETYKLNAQYETPVGHASDVRYGIYAGKLGIGFDWRAASAAQMRVDVFNPNRFQVDARGLFRINDDFSVWLGADSLFREPTPVVGVRLTR